jgi:hypothetical protein
MALETSNIHNGKINAYTRYVGVVKPVEGYRFIELAIYVKDGKNYGKTLDRNR